LVKKNVAEEALIKKKESCNY